MRYIRRCRATVAEARNRKRAAEGSGRHALDGSELSRAEPLCYPSCGPLGLCPDCNIPRYSC